MTLIDKTPAGSDGRDSRGRVLLRYALFMLSLPALLFLSLSGHGPATAPVSQHWRIAIAEDPRASRSPEEMLKVYAHGDFKPLRRDYVNRGYTDSVLWLHLRPRHGNRELEYLEITNPLLDHVDFYRLDAGGVTHSLALGDTQAFRQRVIGFRNFVLPLQPGAVDGFMVRLSSKGPLHFRIHFHETAGLVAHVQRDQLVNGLYFGVLLVMVLYNLMFFLQLGERTYLSYVVYVILFGLMILSLNGMGQQYLWPDKPSWGEYSAPALILLLNMAAIQFVRCFLRTWRLLPRVDRFMLALMGLNALLLPLCVLVDYTVIARIVTLSGLIMAPLMFGIAVLGWLRNDRAARFLALAWVFLMLAIFLTALMFLGLLPTTPLIGYGLQIGSAMEVVLLSWALGDKMALMKREKDAARQRALDLLKAHNRRLDQEVSRRTRALESVKASLVEKNRALEQANLRLREAVTHDGLTGLLNHQAFMDQFEVLLDDACRYAYPVSVVMVDLDFFKQVNDRHGHEAGNEVLLAVAGVFARNLRGSDLAARYGGEEFVLALSHTSTDEALLKAEELQTQIRRIQLPRYPGLSISASMGVAAAAAGAPGLALRHADEALYRAKGAGRDRVCLHRREPGYPGMERNDGGKATLG